MARRNSYPGSRWNQRPGSAYSRSAKWPTRYYQRKIGGTMITALAGLNTTSDDFEKKDGESPYLWNVRLDGTKEERKRAQSMSRLGQKYFCMPAGAETTVNGAVGDERIKLNEKTSIKWTINTSQRMTEIGMRFEFDDVPFNTNGHFVIIVRDANENELCRAYRSVHKLYERAGQMEWFRLIKTPAAGRVVLEATVVDDMDDSGVARGFDIYIKSSGCANHLYSYHDLPNLDESLREKPYEWKKGVGIPAISYKQTNWKVFPVWLQGGYFSANGTRYSVIGAINGSGQKEIYKVKYSDVDVDSGEYKKVSPEVSLMIPASKINQSAEQVRMTQAGNCLYFVDGYSALQKVNLDTWEVLNAVPDMSQVDTFGWTTNMYYYANAIVIEDGHFWRCLHDHEAGDNWNNDKENWKDEGGGESITAWAGASLIYFLNNRLILSGFRHATVGVDTPKAEPNLVIMSSIDSVKPQYDMFNRSVEFFYVPDRAPSSSSHAPVTGFAHIGDYLLIFTTDGLYVESIQSAVEFAGIQQTNPEGSQYGAMKQEHIVEGGNMVYFYNVTMGICRTAGSTVDIISSPIDSIFRGISDKGRANGVLCMTDGLLRFFYNEDGKENDKALIDYATIPQHRSYWYRDNNTPVSATYIDVASDFYMAVHSEYPCMMLMDEAKTDFDCAILYEYYTKYLCVPNRLGHTIVRRIHLTTLQTYQSSIYIGLDYDHNNKPIVWRKFIQPTVKGNFAPDDIFGDDDESGATNIDIRILTTDTRFIQLRLKQYCYDFQAEILQVGFEYANRTTL